MDLESVYNKVVSILENDDTNLNYIKQVYKGYRDNIPESMFPCIMVEVDNAPEDGNTMPNDVMVQFGITIYGVIKVMDKDKQIIGDESIKGILDVNKDIKKSLGAYPTLDGECITYSFPDTRFDFSSYPFRSAEIDVQILLSQSFETRT